MKKQTRNYIIAVIYVVLLVAALMLIFKFEVTSRTPAEKVAFITNGDFSDVGWSEMNYRGVKNACEELGVELLPYSNVTEYDGSCPKLVEQLAKDGVRMIILNSFGYTDEMREQFSQYPDIVFYGASAEINAPNVTAYSSRLYQVRYLSGIVAGMQTKSGKIGIVAANRDSTVCRGLNAFALGVRRVNPDAEVIVAWTESWDDEVKEKQLANALIEKEHVDVITYHQNRPNVIEVAEEHGIASIGYYEPLENVSENYLTCAVCDWQPIYETMIREYLRGQGNSVTSEWLGLRSEAIHLTTYSPLVSKEVRDEVAKASEEIKSGMDVFTGVIYDNQGKERCGVNESMSDETLLHGMDWLVEGVREYAD